MNQSNESTKKLWLTLALLLIVIVLAVWMDHSSLHAFSASDESNTKPSADSNETVNESANITDTMLEMTTGTGEPIYKTPNEATKNTMTVTFLGECAPGSPFGTTAYGSLNALAKENGHSYFFSELTSILGADDLTIAANRCLFTDGEAAQSTLSVAPLENISIYSEASVDIIANLSPDIKGLFADTLRDWSAHGIALVESNTVHYMEINGVEIAILYEHIEKNTDPVQLANTVNNVKPYVDFVILYFHGGEEDSHTVEPWLKNTITSAVRAGASLVIGSGTNVLRPMETIDGVTVIYSLGSLVDGTKIVPENAAALLQLKLTKNDAGEILHEIFVIPTYVYSELWQPTVMNDEHDKAIVHQFLNGETPLPVKVGTEQ